MAHHWDEQTRHEGFQRGYAEGVAEGRYEGYRAQRSDLLHALDTVGDGFATWPPRSAYRPGSMA
jgi:hypothetical protein